MQLHPNDKELASFYTNKCLGMNYVGVDFEEDPGDLTKISSEELNTKKYTNPNNFRAFASEVLENDYILIMLHNMPHALVTEIQDYNYIKNQVEEMGIWFRHFRRFMKISYFGDIYKSKNDLLNSSLIMTNTFSGVTEDSESGRLITEWLTSI